MQSTSWETLDWKKHKLESRLPGEISITSDMQMTPPYGKKQRTKEPLDESENSVQFSRLVVFDSSWPHESQHARPPCPSPTPRVHSDSRPLSQWCHPAISSSVVPCSSCPQSLPASGSYPWVNSSHKVHKSIGVSASTSVPPMNTQDWSPLEWTGWISLQTLRVFSNTTV